MVTEKRYSHDGVTIIDHLKKGLIYIDGKDELLELAEYVDRLQEENKQLKSTIKEVIELLLEEVDLFTDKATEHDINAYIELKELDNKDAFYMAIATKKAIKMLKELLE